MKKPKNWKTTFFGIASVISGVALILKGQLIEGVTAITAGLGLGAAKDYDEKNWKMINSSSAKWGAFTRHILRWEGKTSSDPRDTAAKCYPGGIHTNKGITFCTFRDLAPKLGISPVTHDRFLKLTDKEVGLFIYEFYNAVRGPELPDSVALAATEAAWGSGPGRAFQHLRDSVRDLGKPATSTSQAIQSAKTLPEKQLFDTYQAKRQAFINNLGSQPKYAMFLRGWLNRLRSFNSTFRPAALIFPIFFLGVTLLITSRK